jgi:plasmid stabilization system protein ParE
MRVRYTDAAVAEIDDIFSYIAADSPRAAANVLAQFDKYRQIVRMLPIRRYPQYLVFYAVEKNEVVILNVRPGARRRPWEDRE